MKNTKGEPKDDSVRFKLVGGPYHNKIVRLYAPWDDLTFPDGSCYTLTGPIGKKDEWVYIHKPQQEDSKNDDSKVSTEA